MSHAYTMLASSHVVLLKNMEMFWASISKLWLKPCQNPGFPFHFEKKNTFQCPSKVFVNIALWWKGAMCVKTEAFQQICQGL